MAGWQHSLTDTGSSLQLSIYLPDRNLLIFPMIHPGLCGQLWHISPPLLFTPWFTTSQAPGSLSVAAHSLTTQPVRAGPERTSGPIKEMNIPDSHPVDQNKQSAVYLGCGRIVALFKQSDVRGLYLHWGLTSWPQCASAGPKITQQPLLLLAYRCSINR